MCGHKQTHIHARIMCVGVGVRCSDLNVNYSLHSLIFEGRREATKTLGTWSDSVLVPGQWERNDV